ncbi:Unconventional myosin-IXb [Bagarius yarrelli]|uniref:Unconventional myosin-IXb n=1 Tax=Bagarius yarrelli TaxID=175774 RepID=A0A556TZP6_BAGYA|nr:Unconventional myosin-IXb [Bagarius yarrelli]
MSVQDSTSSTGMSYVLQIYVNASLGSRPSCTVRVRKDTTAALVVQSVARLLQLDSSRLYELTEVREHAGDNHVLSMDDCPVDRLLLWPQGHEKHKGYYFTFQEEKHVRDLCHLAVLNEDTVLETLRSRFYKKQIYTYASNILITINPFQFLPIYNPKYLQQYENCILGKEDPHIFAIADAAFRAMLNKRTNQCIVISGESGSGKTQSTNFLVHSLTTLSRKGCSSGVERTILGAGPVLEGMITGIRGLCNGLGPALYGFVFYLFHVELNEMDATGEVEKSAIIPGPPFLFGACSVLLSLLVALFIPEHNALSVRPSNYKKHTSTTQSHAHTPQGGACESKEPLLDDSSV